MKTVLNMYIFVFGGLLVLLKLSSWVLSFALGAGLTIKNHLTLIEAVAFVYWTLYLALLPDSVDLFDQFWRLSVGGWWFQLSFFPFVLYLHLQPAYQCDNSLY
jgi:hypothetical protein